jgi:hypothetical protein
MSIEKTRKLQSVSLTGSGVVTRDLPKDTYIKGINLQLRGSITTTYGSGTPVSRVDGILNSLVSNISVVINGGRTVKSVTPHLTRMQNLFNAGLQSARGSSAAGTESYLPTTDGTFVFGTTGQLTTVNEAGYIPFEFIWSKKEEERALTWLKTKGTTSAEIRFNQNAYTSLQSAANTAPVAYSASTLRIDISIVEAVPTDAELAYVAKYDFRQTTKQVPFTAQSTGTQIEINRNASLAGIWLSCNDGAAGSTTTATDRLPSNNLVTDINLKANGTYDAFLSTFLELQQVNRQQYGINAAYASNVTPVDGVAHMNFIKNSISDAFNTKGLDSLYLYLSTNSASFVSYTNPAMVTIQTDEIAEISI